MTVINTVLIMKLYTVLIKSVILKTANKTNLDMKEKDL